MPVFSSLSKLKIILESETDFYLQIITHETVNIFEEWLLSICSYNRTFLSVCKVDDTSINLIIDDCNKKVNRAVRTILYGNRVRKEAIQIYFKPTLDEIKNYLQSRSRAIEQYYGLYNITEMKNILLKSNDHLLSYYNYSHIYSFISEKDVQVLYLCSIYGNIEDVYKNIIFYNEQMSNRFLVDCSINMLVNNRYIRKMKNKIKIICTEEYLNNLCDVYKIRRE